MKKDNEEKLIEIAWKVERHYNKIRKLQSEYEKIANNMRKKGTWKAYLEKHGLADHNSVSF